MERFYLKLFLFVMVCAKLGDTASIRTIAVTDDTIAPESYDTDTPVPEIPVRKILCHIDTTCI